MTSGGHFLNLTEAQRLTQEIVVPGVFQEDIRRGGLLTSFPIWQFVGKTAQWRRQLTQQSASVTTLGAGLVWSAETAYSPQEVALKQIYKQTKLDNFVRSVYGTFNNYAAIQVADDQMAMMNTMEDLFLYGDVTYSSGNLEFDGLHALAQASPTPLGETAGVLDIDEGEAGLSLANMRQIERHMKHGIDFWLFPYEIADRLDAYVQENGVSTFLASQINITMDDLGKQVRMWNGIPIIRSDHLVAEEANTGVGSDARAKHSSGNQQFSVFAINMGNVALQEPGVTLLLGGDEIAPGQPWMFTPFEKLESSDAKGIRHMSYLALADGSSMALGRIYDIQNSAIVA
tara:strand:- start:512 stop:1543 length:1032 start_codon:yes stop_codon:yes gene_type:complete